ncbi:NAD+ diphosphatase [Crucibulum laeve]|uniref:NAD(+) diphosphatase n=1 Tax=Crucibulum laeve TaxID=68775 RepID=A0A5C3MHU4_9AGAR|nr:NAD+ diphosphatase [Crucibulum laeve]
MSETHVNTFGGSPLNRLSWLRPSHPFLNGIAALPSTKWLLFNSGQPLVASTLEAPSKSTPVYLSTNDVKPFLGEDPYFGQGKSIGEVVSEEGAPEHSPTEAVRHRGGRIVFLGLHEPQSGDKGALPSSEFKDPESALAKIHGTPYFALDVADLELSPEQIQDILKKSTPGTEGRELSWTEPRALMSTLDNFSAAIFASARSMVDWNQRNKFCPACGSPTYSMWGGWKIACSTLLPWSDNSGRKLCPTAKGLHNFTHPRTDAVVIMIAIDETGDKVLLGRGRKFPGKFYSALAGFIEPGESFEDAVAREMWEEAGVNVWNVKYHSGQPWPYPANLMVGFYARADSKQTIRTDLDNELVDARWFTREEVLAVLNHKSGTRFGRNDYKKMSEMVDGKDPQKPETEPAVQAFTPSEATAKAPEAKVEQYETPFRVPPITAIAGVLIKDWAEGRIGFSVDGGDTTVIMQKGNL